MRTIPSFDQFLAFIKSFEGKCLLITHEQADLDAIGSLIGFTSFIRKLNPSLEIIIPEPQISILSQKLLQTVRFNFHEWNEHKPRPTAIFLLDTNVYDESRYPEYDQVIIIDHHVPNPSYSNLLFDYQLEDFNSTTEIITCFYYHANFSLDSEIAKSLLAGIIFDSRRFVFSDEDLFDCVRYLLENCPDCYREVISLTTKNREYSEKIACIKAAQRSKRIMLGKYIILFSHVSSYEASAARSLIFLGADLAIVAALREDSTRISMRATPDFVSQTGLSLGGSIIPLLIDKFGGIGGGHDGAAGFNTIKLSLKDVSDYLIQIIKKKLSY